MIYPSVSKNTKKSSKLVLAELRIKKNTYGRGRFFSSITLVFQSPEYLMSNAHQSALKWLPRFPSDSYFIRCLQPMGNPPDRSWLLRSTTTPLLYVPSRVQICCIDKSGKPHVYVVCFRGGGNHLCPGGAAESHKIQTWRHNLGVREPLDLLSPASIEWDKIKKWIKRGVLF